METPNIVIELYSGVGRPNTALELTGKKLALFPSRSPPALGNKENSHAARQVTRAQYGLCRL
jgi:hypothetical protein